MEKDDKSGAGTEGARDREAARERTPDPRERKAKTQMPESDAVRARAEERKARLARTLRDNLSRRKQQARARRAGAADDTDGLPGANPSLADLGGEKSTDRVTDTHMPAADSPGTPGASTATAGANTGHAASASEDRAGGAKPAGVKQAAAKSDESQS